MKKKAVITIVLAVMLVMSNQNGIQAIDFVTDDYKLQYIHPEDYQDNAEYIEALNNEKQLVSVMCLVLSCMNVYTEAVQIPLAAGNLVLAGTDGLLTYEQLRSFTEWFIETDLKDPEEFIKAVELGYSVAQGTFKEDVLVSSEINKRVIRKLNLRIGQRSEMARVNLISKKDTILMSNERFTVFWEPTTTLPALEPYLLGFSEMKAVDENYDYTGDIVENTYYTGALESIRNGTDNKEYGSIFYDYSWEANYFQHTSSYLAIDEIYDENYAYVGKSRRIGFDLACELDPQNSEAFYNDLIRENYPDGSVEIRISVYDNQSGTYIYRHEKMPANITETGWLGFTDNKNFLLRFNIDIGSYYYETHDFADAPDGINWLLFYIAESSYKKGDYACEHGGNLYEPSEDSCELHKYCWAQIRQQTEPDPNFQELTPEQMMSLESCWDWGENGPFIAFGFVPASLLIDKGIISDEVAPDIIPGNIPQVQVEALEQQQRPPHEDNEEEDNEEEDKMIELKSLEIEWDEIFPFCLPWDFMYFLSVINVDAEVPRQEFDVMAVPAAFGMEETYVHYRVDLSDYENEMIVIRSMELYTFAVSLVMLTGKLIIF